MCKIYQDFKVHCRMISRQTIISLEAQFKQNSKVCPCMNLAGKDTILDMHCAAVEKKLILPLTFLARDYSNNHYNREMKDYISLELSTPKLSHPIFKWVMKYLKIPRISLRCESNVTLNSGIPFPKKTRRRRTLTRHLNTPSLDRKRKKGLSVLGSFVLPKARHAAAVSSGKGHAARRD